MALGKRGRTNVSPEKCFEAWLESGTSKNAVKLLAEWGIFGRGGNPVHFNTVRRNAFIHILNNPEETRKILRERGIYLAMQDDLWDDYTIKKAKAVFIHGGSIKSFYAWLEKNGLLERAKELGYITPKFSVESVL